MKLEKNRYRLYLVLHVFVVIAVILFFKFIPDVKTAALCAGVLFLLGPTFVILREIKAQTLFKSLSSYGALIFLVGFSLPILGLRLMNWDEPFETLSLPQALGGFTGPQLHHYSTYFFYVMLGTFFVDSLLTSMRAKQKGEA